MWPKAQNEMAGLSPHAAMGPVERMVRRHCPAIRDFEIAIASAEKLS